MPKVAYNACFGGFSLSTQAVKLGRKLSNDPKWGGIALKGELYSDGYPCTSDYGGHCLDGEFPRHDPVLIKVIESLGKRANGFFANLVIRELPSGSRYRIDEYDGNERVMTPEDYTWIEV